MTPCPLSRPSAWFTIRKVHWASRLEGLPSFPVRRLGVSTVLPTSCYVQDAFLNGTICRIVSTRQKQPAGASHNYKKATDVPPVGSVSGCQTGCRGLPYVKGEWGVFFVSVCQEHSSGQPIL